MPALRQLAQRLGETLDALTGLFGRLPILVEGNLLGRNARSGSWPGAAREPDSSTFFRIGVFAFNRYSEAVMQPRTSACRPRPKRVSPYRPIPRSVAKPCRSVHTVFDAHTACR